MSISATWISVQVQIHHEFLNLIWLIHLNLPILLSSRVLLWQRNIKPTHAAHIKLIKYTSVVTLNTITTGWCRSLPPCESLPRIKFDSNVWYNTLVKTKWINYNWLKTIHNIIFRKINLLQLINYVLTTFRSQLLSDHQNLILKISIYQSIGPNYTKTSKIS